MPAGGALLYYRLSHSKAEYSFIEYDIAKEWHVEAIRWRDCLVEVGDKNQESKKNCRRNSGKCEDGGREGGKLALNSFKWENSH